MDFIADKCASNCHNGCEIDSGDGENWKISCFSRRGRAYNFSARFNSIFSSGADGIAHRALGAERK